VRQLRQVREIVIAEKLDKGANLPDNVGIKQSENESIDQNILNE
jgi:hypothetical protein